MRKKLKSIERSIYNYATKKTNSKVQTLNALSKKVLKDDNWKLNQQKKNSESW